MNTLIIGNLSDQKFISKTKPIFDLEYIKKVYIFRSNGNVYKKNKKAIYKNFLFGNYNSKFILFRLIYDFFNFLFFLYLSKIKKIDLIIGIYLYPHALYASVLSKLTNTPLIILLPGSDLKKLIKTRRNIDLFKNANFLGVRGSNSLNNLLNIGFEKEKLFIHHNQFDIKNFTFYNNSNKIYDIIVFSILRKPKRVDVAINLIFNLKKDFPDIKCLIYGSGSEKKSLIRHASSLDLEKNIVFKDFKNESTVTLLNSSKIFLMTSKSEGLPMTLVESMSCGIPAVVSNINDISDLVKNNYNGYLVDPNNYNDYLNSLKKLLSDDDKRILFSINARNTIEKMHKKHYSNNSLINSWDLLIKKCVNLQT